MTRPRESLLNLFDPLNFNEPSTPERRSEGSRSPDSDKENAQPGEVTAFFNRTYTRQKLPMKPMKRLVDVGDITAVFNGDGVGNGLGLLIEEDEEEEAIYLTDDEVDSTPRNDAAVQMFPDDDETPMQRAPFTDITPEATPVARKRTYRRDEISSIVVPSNQTSPGISRAPSGSPLASIINAINFADAYSDTNPVHDRTNGEHIDQNPQLTVSSASDSALVSSTANLIPSASCALLMRTTDPTSIPVSDTNPTPSSGTLDCSTAHLVPSTTSALLTHIPLPLLPLAESVSESDPGYSPPPTCLPPSTSTSPPKSASKSSPPHSRTPSPTKSDKSTNAIGKNPSNARPVSAIDLDLHSSFNIHLQNPETSFDLLNDRISFCGLDNSLSASMDVTMAGHGPDMGIESSIMGRRREMDESTFDVKDEEEKMRAFLGMRTGWNEGGVSVIGKKTSPIRKVETASKSNHSTPQPKPKSPLEARSSSTDDTPKAAVKITTGIQKKRLSSSLSSLPSATVVRGAMSPVDSPLKPQNIGAETSTVHRRSLAATTPATRSPTRTPSKVAYVAPPPVPALRIIKRANVNASAKPQPHRRTSSVPSNGGSSSMTAGRPSIAGARPLLPQMPAQQKVAHKPSLQGVLRPRPSKVSTVAGPPRTTFGFGSKIVKPREKVPCSRPTSVVETGMVAKNNTGVSGRLPTAPGASSKGLRQPLRFGYSGATTSDGNSALPKSTSASSSRLPAPSGTRITRVGSSAPAIGMSRRLV